MILLQQVIDKVFQYFSNFSKIFSTLSVHLCLVLSFVIQINTLDLLEECLLADRLENQIFIYVITIVFKYIKMTHAYMNM